MKLKINIRKVAEKRGIKNAYQLQKLVSLTPSNAAKIFNHEFSQISMATLEKLCDKLECLPNDLFKISNSKTSKKSD